MITITKALPSREQLLTLYDSVGWSAYTKSDRSHVVL